MTLRLVAAPDGAVTELDRAIWLTWPFGLPWTVYVPPDNRAWLAVSDAVVNPLGLSDVLAWRLSVSDEGDW